MNINDFDRLYRRTVNGVGSSSGVVYLELDRVKPHRLRTLTHVTVEDKTTACTTFRLCIKNTGRTHYIDELDSPTAAELAVSRSDIQLGEQDVFAAEITGSTDGDILVLTAIGWEKDLK